MRKSWRVVVNQKAYYYNIIFFQFKQNALFLSNVFGFQEFSSGMIFTASGLIIVLNQGLLLKKFWLKRFREPDLELYALLFLGAGFLFNALGVLWIFAFGVVLTTFSQAVLRVVMMSQIAGLSGDRRGEINGVMNSLMSASLVVGPITAGWLFTFQNKIPFLLAGILCLIAFIVVYWNRKKLAKIKMEVV